MANIFNDFELNDFIDLDEMMWAEEGIVTTLTVANASHSLSSPQIGWPQTVDPDDTVHAVISAPFIPIEDKLLAMSNISHALTSDEVALITPAFNIIINGEWKSVISTQVLIAGDWKNSSRAYNLISGDWYTS